MFFFFILTLILGFSVFGHHMFFSLGCQVGLVRSQLRRATDRYGGPLNSMVLSRALSQPLEKDIDPLQQGNNRVIGSLHLPNIGNIDHEVREKVNISSVESRGSDTVQEPGRLKNSSSSSELCVAKTSETADIMDTSMNKDLEDNKKGDSLVVPEDFLCPISLELMRDPVIVSTGQVVCPCATLLLFYIKSYSMRSLIVLSFLW